MRAIRTNRESLAQQIKFNPTFLYAQRLQIRRNFSIEVGCRTTKLLALSLSYPERDICVHMPT